MIKLNISPKEFNFYNLGELLFLIGIFFLCSSILISGIFLISSFIISNILRNKEDNYFQDKWNYPFILCGLLIIFSSIMQKFFLPNDFNKIWDPNLSLIGMANWIPFFWIFWASQTYLNTKAKRKKFALVLISGTFPLLVTGFGQYYFDWTGPFKTLNGLIIWFQRPIETPGGLSGLFSNQNYAGSWLNLVWPFCIAFTLENTKNLVKKSTSICFLISIGFAIFLTYSRNAWAGLFIAFPFVMVQEGLLLVISFCILFAIILFFLISAIFSGDLQSVFKEIIPNKIILEFSKEGYKDIDATRIEILKSALELINIRPLLGFGAASFTAIYELQTNFYKGHSHNLFTELAISYGLPVSIIFTITIISILVISFYVIFLKKDLNTKKIDFFERALWSSVFFFFLSQLFDIQYFDGKISIVFWILLSSLKNILEEGNLSLVKDK